MSQQSNDSTLEQTLEKAHQTTANLQFKGERAEAVRLAVQTLLLIRGGLPYEIVKNNPYPILVKYIRASNAETLGALADDVLRAISPNFITLRSLGSLAEAIYNPTEDLAQLALQLLQEETTPLVMLMKKIYQDARGYDEADANNSEQGGKN